MRTLLLSDTHGLHHEIELPKRKCKAVIHTGDFSNSGTEEEALDFLEWYSSLPCKHKILVAGNHDWYVYNNQEKFKELCEDLGITYLQDSGVEIEGIKFYGTPWVTRFYDWAFMLPEASLIDKYRLIPQDTDVLLTHGPAFRILDEVSRGHVGSLSLRHVLANLDIKYHMFGHIHESRGEKKRKGTRHLNNAMVDHWYNVYKPKVINIKV